MRVKIKITKEILEKTKMCGTEAGVNGKYGIAANCAVAVASRELFGNVSVTKEEIIAFLPQGKHIEIPLPKEAQDLIAKFDTTHPINRPNIPPMSFEVEVPNEMIENIGIGEAYKVLSESKTLELISI